MLLIVANTVIGRPGNVGYRIGNAIQGMDKKNYFILSRGLEIDLPGKSLGIVGLICRFLNSIRRYLVPSFNSRRYDIYLFNIGVIVLFYTVLPNRKHIKTVYLCETSTFLAKFFRRKGFKIILDLPIAPALHISKIKKLSFESGLKFNNFLHNQEVQTFHIVDCIISPSSYISNFLSTHFQPSNVVTIPFGVNSTKNIQVQKSNDDKNEKVIFGFIGNISPRKGCHILLKAWSKLDKKQKTSLVLQGKVYPGYKKFLNQKDITYYEFGDSETFFNEIDILVLPSFMEGSAKVIYEAVASGIPVIASEYSGAPYYDGYGIIKLDSVNENELINIMNIFIEKSPYKLNEDYIKKFTECFSWKEYSRKVQEVLLCKF